MAVDGAQQGMAGRAPEVLIDDLTVAYERHPALHHVSGIFRSCALSAVVGPKTGTSEVTPSADAAAGIELAVDEGTPDVSGAATISKGHGRNGAAAYEGAERIEVAHPSLRAGDACPACGEGTVYEKTPAVLVRTTGQPPLAATVYQLQKLRCDLCGQIFTADAPTPNGLPRPAATYV